MSAPAGAVEDLSAAEVRDRLAQFGRKEVAEPKPGVLAALSAKLWRPLPWMLEAAVVLQAFLGEYLQAAVILALLVFNALLAFAQESRPQVALEALNSRLALTASVRRDGSWVTLQAAGGTATAASILTPSKYGQKVLLFKVGTAPRPFHWILQ
jgi:H+-transporting ATPase